MRHSRAWRSTAYALRVAVVCLTLIGGMFSTLIPAYAGTTGTITGTVTDKNTGTPVAGVAVSAQAATGSYHAVTDARGFYSMTGVFSDTYTISFAKTGYDAQSVTGITVNADQEAKVSYQMQKAIPTEIGHVTARASGGTAFNPTQTTNTVTINANQIIQAQGSEFNISETNLLAQLPGVIIDVDGRINVHGARENESGFEFDGIPYTDAFTNQFVNSLAIPGGGVNAAQVTAGAGDASTASAGTGVVNLVAQRGTYPGHTSFDGEIGGPGFNHSFIGTMSYASANGHISDYATFDGEHLGELYDNGQFPAVQIGRVNSTLSEPHTEFLNNLVFRFGRDNREQLQLFTDVGYTNFLSGYGGLAGECFQTCSLGFLHEYEGLYGLTATQIQSITPLTPFQTSATETLLQANRAANSQYQPFQTVKLGYTLNINPSTYLSFNAYSVNSVSTFDEASTLNSPFNGGFFLQGGHQVGSTIKLQKQFGEHNLVEAGAEYNFLHPEEQGQSPDLAWVSPLFDPTQALGTFGAPFDFLPNSPGCNAQASRVLGPGSTCGYALTATGGAPTQFPQYEQNTTLNRSDFDYYLQDQITFSDKVNLHVGVRNETSDFIGLPTPQLLSDCTFQFEPGSVTNNTNFNPNNPAVTGNCPFLPNFNNITRSQTHPSVLEPRIGLSWQTDRNTAIRANFERTSIMPFLGFTDNILNRSEFNAFNNLAPTSASCGIFPFTVPCSSYGSQLYWAQQNGINGIPYEPILPTVSNNYEVSFEHQFTKGTLNGVSVSLSPWTRHQYNTEASTSLPILGADGQPVLVNNQQINSAPVAGNLGKEFASGVDFNVVRDRPYGISAEWAVSYINEFTSAIPGQGNEDFFPTIPFSSIALGNVYRSGLFSPLQTRLSLSYKTRSGWRINPRFRYDIGYPIGSGTLTTTLLNGVATTVPNLGTLPGSAASNAGIGSPLYIDPVNPGSLFAPNVIATTGANEKSSAGGVLSPPEFNMDLSFQYSPPQARFSLGFDVFNLFNHTFGGPFANGLYQPLATGFGGPLTGASNTTLNYQTPYAIGHQVPAFGGNQFYENIPSGIGRSFDFYITTKI